MNVETGSTSDDIAAVISSMGEGSAPAPAEGTPAPTPSEPASSGPVRGPDGRFQAASGSAPAAPGAPPAAPGTPAATPTPEAASGPAPAAPEGAPAAPAAPAAGVVTLDPSKPPQGWRAEAKAKWDTIPEDLRQEIIRREEASAQGVAQLRQEYEPLDRLDAVLGQYSDYLQHIGAEPETYLSNLIQAEQSLALGNPAQKMQTIISLADSYGIPLRQVIDSAMGGQLDAVMKQSHQYHNTPPQVPPQVQRELETLRRQQQELIQQQAQQELDQFLKEPDKYPFFNEVSEQMADLIEAGVCKNYADAYEFAVWRDPAMRTRAIAMMNGQQQASGVRARQQQAASVSTPNPAPIASAPPNTADESMEDTIRRAWADSASGGRA